MASPDTANVTTGPGTLMYAPLGTTEPATRVAAWPAGWVAVGYTAEGHSFSSSLSIDDVEVAELLDPVRRVTTKRDTKVAFAMAEITLAHLKLLLNGGTTTPDSQTFAGVSLTSGDATVVLSGAALTSDDEGKTITGLAGVPASTTILSVTNATTLEMSANASATTTTSITIVGRHGSYLEPPQVGDEVRVMLGFDSEDGLERVIWRRVLQSGNSEIARRKGADFARFNAEFSLEQPGGGLAPFRWFFAEDRVAA
jgi:hypothetical protein